MKEYGWRVPEAQRANLIMVEENMTALENGVQASKGGSGKGAAGGTEGGGGVRSPKFVRERSGMCSFITMHNPASVAHTAIEPLLVRIDPKPRRGKMFSTTRKGAGGGGCCRPRSLLLESNVFHGPPRNIFSW